MGVVVVAVVVAIRFRCCTRLTNCIIFNTGRKGSLELLGSKVLHTQHPFNSLLYRTAWVSGTRKVNHSGFYWSKRQWGGSKSFTPRSRQITTPLQHLIARFLWSRCSLWCSTNSVKAVKANTKEIGLVILTSHLDSWQIVLNIWDTCQTSFVSDVTLYSKHSTLGCVTSIEGTQADIKLGEKTTHTKCTDLHTEKMIHKSKDTDLCIVRIFIQDQSMKNTNLLEDNSHENLASPTPRLGGGAGGRLRLRRIWGNQ